MFYAMLDNRMNTSRFLFCAVVGAVFALILMRVFTPPKQPSSQQTSALVSQDAPQAIGSAEQEQDSPTVIESSEENQGGKHVTRGPTLPSAQDQDSLPPSVPPLIQASTASVDSHWTPGVETRSQAPLILTSDEIDPDVRFLGGGDQLGANLLLKLPTKTSEEIQTISEQLGDIIYDGQLVKRGPSPGAVLQSGGTNIGLAFYYRTREEAEAVARLLRSAADKGKQ